MSAATFPREGSLQGDAHRFPVRVYYEDTDAAGIVYYANYLKFIERARTEMMRLYGVEHEKARQSGGAAFIVRRCEIDYRAPARLDDELVVETRLKELRRRDDPSKPGRAARRDASGARQRAHCLRRRAGAADAPAG